MKGTGIELKEGDSDMRHYIYQRTIFSRKLMKVYREQTGDVETQPITIGGGTYARAMENAVAFGPVISWTKEVLHQKMNLYLLIILIKITKIYAQALL